MKFAKSFLITTLAVILLGGLVPGLWAAEPPRGDFTLSDGHLRIRNSGDPSVSDIFNKHLFARLKIEVKDGVVSGSTWITVPERPEGLKFGTAQRFSGTNSIKISGNYDTDTGGIRGKFKLEDDIKYARDTAWGARKGAWKGQSKGKFSGAATGGDQAVLTFQGNGNSQSRSQRDDGTWDNESGGGSYLFKVAFMVAPDKPAAEPQANPKPEDKVSDFDKEILEEYGKKNSGAGFSGISGQVEIHIPGEPEDKWHLVKLDTAIPAGARIKTDEDSSAIIGFADMSTYIIKPGTQIVIATPPEKDSKLRLVAGNIWANVKKMIKDGSMEVEMNQAVAGIKGTTFVLEETGGSSTLKVIEGIVDFTSKSNGKSIKVNAGEMTVATKDGIKQTAFDADKENAEWEELRSQIENKGSSTWILVLTTAGVLALGLLAFKIISGRKKQ